MAYVQQVYLEDYALARENNERAIALFSGFTSAKYNLAICFLKLGRKEEAAVTLQSIGPTDEDAKSVYQRAQRDEKLGALLKDPELGEKVRKHLRTLSA